MTRHPQRTRKPKRPAISKADQALWRFLRNVYDEMSPRGDSHHREYGLCRLVQLMDADKWWRLHRQLLSWQPFDKIDTDYWAPLTREGREVRYTILNRLCRGELGPNVAAMRELRK